MTDVNVSRAAVAIALGVDPATVSQWRQGRAAPKAENLPLLAQLLSVSEGWIRYGEGSSVREETLLYQARVELPLRLDLMALDFERDLVAMGADATERTFAREQLRNPANAAMFLYGADGQPQSTPKQVAAMQMIIDATRDTVLIRMKARGHTPRAIEPPQGPTTPIAPPADRLGEEDVKSHG